MRKRFLVGAFLVASHCCSIHLAAQQKGVSPVQPVAGTLQSGNTYAIVVGISDYQDPGIPDLRFADRDAAAFANFLRSPAGGGLDGDHLKMLTNEQATAGNVGAALYWLVDECKEGDKVIIYFSGHGDVERKLSRQPGFLLCWDSPPAVYISGGVIELGMFQTVISTLSTDIKAQVTVITDACHAGKLAGSSVGGAQLTNANLAQQYAKEVKILSCQPDEYSIEGEQWGGGRGAFSYNLVDALYGMADANSDLSVTLREVGRYLEDHVAAEAAPVNQSPRVLGNPNERLATVDAQLLAALRSGRTSQMALLSPIESRGMEEDVLAGVDTTVRETYRLFKKALKDKVFLLAPPGEPASACADAYYERLLAEPKMARLHSTMTRNFAAALQDDAQQAINIWLKADVQQLECIGKSLRLEPIPRQLARAAELLGEGHYMYRSLLARKLLFEGILMARLDLRDNHDEALGRQCLSIFRKSLELESNSPLPWHRMSQVYVKMLRQPDSAFICAEQARTLAPNWVLPFADLGYTLTQTGKFDLSKQALLEAEKIDSLHPYVVNRWAAWYWNQRGMDNTEKAIALYEQYRKSGGATYPCWHNDYAIALTQVNKYEAAETEYRKAIELDSSKAIIWSNLGSTYLKTRRFDEAEKAFEKAIALDSTYLVTWNQLGTFYFKSRRFAEAEPIFKKLIALDPTYKDAWGNLGAVYNMTNRFAEAEPFLKKAIALDSTYSLCWNNLGYLYLKTRRFDEAEKAYEKAVGLDSSDAFIWSNLGGTYLETRRFDEAEKAYEKAIALDSTYTIAWNNLGQLNGKIHRFDEAEKAFKKAIALDSTSKIAWNNLGLLNGKIHRFDEAEKAFNKAIALDSTSKIAWNNLGWLYTVSKRYEEAEQLLKKVITMDSTYSYPWGNLGYLYSQTRRYAEAEQYSKKGIALDSTNSYAWVGLGNFYLKTNHPKEARYAFNQAMKSKNTDYPEVLLGMAYLLITEGKAAEALSYVEQSIETGSSCKELESDENLATLRTTPAWEALMKKHFPDQHKD